MKTQQPSQAWPGQERPPRQPSPSSDADSAMRSLMPSLPQRTAPQRTEPALARHARSARQQRARQQHRTHRIVAVVLLACFVLFVSATAFGAVTAYQQLSDMRRYAQDGLGHLQAAQALVQPFLQRPSIPSDAVMQLVRTDLTAAQQDFAAARREAQNGAIAVAGYLPVLGTPVRSGQALVAAADEATQGGLDFLASIQTVAPVLRGGFFASDGAAGGSGSPSAPPTLTPALLTQATSLYDAGLQHVTRALALAQNADLSALPNGLVSPSQMSLLRSLLAAGPGLHAQLQTLDSWLHVAPSLLGVNGPEQFLIELMDRGEVRPTGGFIGSYGVVTLHNGKIQPFTLNDVYSLDAPYVAQAGWPPPPSQYAWWPFGGYALRDSNLSFDFPTSAREGIRLLEREGGPQVRGVVAITAPVIARVLEVTGPVPLPEYGVSVTSENLETLIRHYTETGAMAEGHDLPVNDQLTTLHQRFTALLGRALMVRLRGLTGKQFVAVAAIVESSLRTKDLQIYFSDTAAEALLANEGLDAALARGPGDSVTIVDANITGNKANLFTTVNYADAVAIDQHGSVTHHLTITYHFASASNPSMDYYLYNRYFYKTYLRVYVPAGAHLLNSSGFNGGDVQARASDERGCVMWGGSVIVHDGTPYSLHFTWAEAAAAKQDSTATVQYSLLFQHQPASQQHLALTITRTGNAKPLMSFDGALDTDKLFQLPAN